MREVYLVSVCLLILFLLLGCSKTTESKKKSDIIETDDYIIEKYTGKDCKGINFAGTSIVDGRFMYLFYSMPDEFRFYSEEEYYEDAVDKRLAYYTYDDLKSRYILYKQVGDIPEKREYIKDDGNRPYWETYNRDRILDDKYNKYVVYEEDIYHDYHGTVNGKGYIYVYDLDNDTTSCMCIDDVCSGDIDKTELGKLAGKPQLLNDSTLAIADYNIILVYNFKESKTEYLNLNAYKDFSEESDDIFEYYYDSDILNVYCYDNASNNRNLVVYQFEMNKKQLKCKKSFDTEEFEPEFYDEYIVLSKNGTHYIVDAKTLEIIVDLAKFETDKGSVEKATYYGKIKKSIDVSIKDDNAYIVSDNGVKKVDLNKKDVKKIECTDGLKVKAACITDEYMFLVTKEGIYKVDINKDYIEKIGNVDNDIKLVTTKGLIYNSTGVYSDGSIYLRSTYDYENLERFGFDYYLHIHSKDNND